MAPLNKRQRSESVEEDDIDNTESEYESDSEPEMIDPAQARVNRMVDSMPSGEVFKETFDATIEYIKHHKQVFVRSHAHNTEAGAAAYAQAFQAYYLEYPNGFPEVAELEKRVKCWVGLVILYMNAGIRPTPMDMPAPISILATRAEQITDQDIKFDFPRATAPTPQPSPQPGSTAAAEDSDEDYVDEDTGSRHRRGRPVARAPVPRGGRERPRRTAQGGAPTPEAMSGPVSGPSALAASSMPPSASAPVPRRGRGSAQAPGVASGAASGPNVMSATSTPLPATAPTPVAPTPAFPQPAFAAVNPNQAVPAMAQALQADPPFAWRPYIAPAPYVAYRPAVAANVPTSFETSFGPTLVNNMNHITNAQGQVNTAYFAVCSNCQYQRKQQQCSRGINSPTGACSRCIKSGIARFCCYVDARDRRATGLYAGLVKPTAAIPAWIDPATAFPRGPPGPGPAEPWPANMPQNEPGWPGGPPANPAWSRQP